MNHFAPDSGERPPVACDMSTAQDTPAERLDEYQRLFNGFLVGRERSEAAIRFRFRADPGIEPWVRDLAAREKACCAFFNVAVTKTDHEVLWDVSVIDDAMARMILADFYRLPDALAIPGTGDG
ncbi:MAG TPA: hypothetical protein VJT16_07025 [Streptosporangiaceae bacterium]|jgi:hypothetical protein|nr:hypothetical protein [Streptosporangiaceae bacterium]